MSKNKSKEERREQILSAAFSAFIERGYNNTTVDWLGFYAQGNYVSGPINAYGMIGQSSIAYSYQDMFTIFQKKITADPEQESLKFAIGYQF